jgi:type I restriction enzyme S subunit
MAKYRFEQIAINSTEKKKPVEEDRFTYLGLEHLDSGSLKVTRFGSDVAPIGEKLVMRKGDVLFGKRRAYQKKVAIAPFDGIFSAHGMVLRPNVEVIDPDFFPLFISSDYFLDAAIKISVGSLSPTINWRDLKILEFDLPDLETQRKLAAVLWSINDTMESYKKLISATDELVKSQFMEQFGSYLGDETRCATVEQVCTVFADGDWIESKDQADDGIRLIQTGNVGNGVYLDKGERARYIDEETFVRLNCTEVLPNDILISRLPDPVGRACIIPDGLGKSITAVDCSIVRLKSHVLPEFFVAYTMTTLYAAQIGSSVTGSTRKRISRKNLGQVVIPTPDIDQQEQFAAFVRQSDKSKLLISRLEEFTLMDYRGHGKM